MKHISVFILLVLAGCGGDGLDGLEGNWRSSVHQVLQNTCPQPNSLYESTSFHLEIEEVGPDEGFVKLCGLSGCIDWLQGPMKRVDDTWVWTVIIDTDDFQEPDFDCVIHEEIYAVLELKDGKLIMISSPEQFLSEGEDCDEAEAYLQALDGGRDTRVDGCEIIQYNELVRP